MLARLSIRDIVLIERLDIDFSSGLAVLTVDFHECRTDSPQSLDADALIVDEGARAAIAELHPAQNHLAAVVDDIVEAVAAQQCGGGMR